MVMVLIPGNPSAGSFSDDGGFSPTATTAGRGAGARGR
jgi:hypothetical protein